MNKKNKAIVWLIIFIVLIAVFCSVATYAYFNFQTKMHGDFDVDITSKGVDVLSFNAGDDANIVATANNFAPGIGHNLTGSTDVEVRLETTNPTSSFCYEVYVKLPKKEVFKYSVKGRAELVLDVQKSLDNIHYESVISNMDITTKTGNIKIPVNKFSDNYVNIISTTKNQTVYQYWKAKITLIWFNDAGQDINDKKTYTAALETKRVECK